MIEVSAGVIYNEEGRILVCRAKGRFITSEELVDAVRDAE